jgi:N6-L-threonylcarbamoyladenine synthase
MLILGIETSCDETAVALVRDGRLLGQELATQVDTHALFGGVVPEIASREHLRVLPRLYRELMRKTGVDAGDLDGVAVARGPGLLGSLLVGVSFAKGLSLASGASLIGVNHLWAHLLAPGWKEPLNFRPWGCSSRAGTPTPT